MKPTAACHVSLPSFPEGDANLATLLADWRRDAPRLGVLALVPEAEAARVPALQQAFAAAGVPLVGGIFPALVTKEGFVQQGAWLLRFDEMPHFALLDGWEGDAAVAARQVAAFVDGALGSAEEPPTLFLIMDAMLPNIASILEQLYGELADAVRYVGVNAGSETFSPMRCLFDGERVVERGALCLLWRDRRPYVLEHGFVAPPESLTATATERNRVLGIDWRPAFEVYRGLVKRDFGVELTPENFYQHAVHYPLGIVRACDEVVVRIPVALEADGSLHCVGEVPPNAMLTLLQGPREGANACIPRLVAALGEAMAGAPVGDLVTFYCAGRRMQMGDAATAELARLVAETRPHVLAGALSLGELGNERGVGYPLFHNAALVCLPWSAT